MNDTRSMTRARRVPARAAVVLCLLLAIGVLPTAAFAAPTTVADVSAMYLNSATISLMAPGATSTSYQLDGGATVGGTSATTSKYGAHVLKFWSVDASGTEAPVSAPFFVDDSVLPEVSSDCAASYPATATIKLRATDNFNGSGIDFLCYRVDGGRINTVIAPASVAATKVFFARLAAVTSVDVKTASTVDPGQTPPHGDFGECAGCHDVVVPTPDPTSTPEPTGTPSVSGVSRTVVVGGVGTHTIEYWTQDIARNTTAHVVKTFSIAKMPTTTTLKASVTSVRSGGYVTLTAKLIGGTFTNQTVRFEVKQKGSNHYDLLKTVKVGPTGTAIYRYKVVAKGTRYHRVRFLGDATFAAAPVRPGIALLVK